MKKLSLCMLFVFAYSLSFAQNYGSSRTAFQCSIVTPLGTNGLQSSKFTNGISLNLLFGVSQNELAFTLGGLSNVILNSASGVQIAGLTNHVGNYGRGVQIAGLANMNRTRFSGVQLAGLFNVVGDVRGLQIAGLTNHVGNYGRGVQIAGLTNTNRRGFSGMQLSGLLNASCDVRGFQLSGLINIAKDVEGFQLSGLINIAKDVEGVQLAGLINVAQSSDCPIGLINIIRKGEMGIAITYDALGNSVLSFRSGGRYTYGILGVGYNHKMGENGLVSEAGFGAHIPVVKWFRINNELKVSNIGCDDSEPIFNGGYSLLPAFKIGKHIELFAGVGINYMQTDDITKSNIFPNNVLWEKSCYTKLQQIYIGYQAGIQFIF